MRWLFACLAVAACGHAPPPKHVAAEVSVTGVATLAGTWVTNDDMDWGYRLVLVPDGRFALAIDRGKLGHCEQRGRLAQAADPRSYTLTLTKDSCTPNGATGGSLPISIASYTGEALTISYVVGGGETRRTYQRDPNAKRSE